MTSSNDGQPLTMATLQQQTSFFKRYERDLRWLDNAHAAIGFQLRMGYERAGDKTRFLKQYGRYL